MSIPLLEVEIDRDGQLVDPLQEQAIVSSLTSGEGLDTTDVVVLSHGWNNNLDDARTLYADFIRFLDKEPAFQNGRKVIAIGLLWPSKKFEDGALISGGAASAGSNPAADQVLLQSLEEMKGLLSEPTSQALLEKLKALIPDLEKDSQTQSNFVSLLGKATKPFVYQSQISDDEGRKQLADESDGPALLRRLAVPIQPRVTVGSGGATAFGRGSLGGNPALSGSGGAAGISDYSSGIKAGALRLLNFVTYYVMKDRAGNIGRNTVNPLLNRIQQAVAKTQRSHSVLFHLVGHSFGGRLVTAAVDGPERLQVQTLLLLQAAYSHNGLSSDFDGQGKKGFFYSVVNDRKVTGPILITHSMHDSAVGLAYPIASRINGVDASSVGDASDRFGGMGANGAQHITQKVDVPLLSSDGVYNFALPGVQVFNLNGDSIIMSHGDVARAETAHVLAAAMTMEAVEAAGAVGAGVRTATGS